MSAIKEDGKAYLVKHEVRGFSLVRLCIFRVMFRKPIAPAKEICERFNHGMEQTLVIVNMKKTAKQKHHHPFITIR